MVCSILGVESSSGFSLIKVVRMQSIDRNGDTANFAEVVIRLSDAKATRRDIAGGKAASLAALLDVGFSVPEGIVITTNAYELFSPQLMSENRTTPHAEADLPVDFRNYLLKEIVKVNCLEEGESLQGNPRFAVRSSAIAEDTVRTSYAGMFTSFLNVELDEIPFYVLKCWQSSLNDAAKYYSDNLSKRFGHAVDLRQMAVLIQRMVQAKVAGVAFTADPLTLEPSRIMITMCRGLGTDAVNGKANTVNVMIDRSDARLLVSSSQDVDMPVPGDVLRHLGELLLKIEAFFDTPVDVEWSWDGKTLWILQTRPITSAGSSNFDKSTIWSNTNLSEILPGIPTPATWSTISYALDYAFKDLFRDFGYTWPAPEGAVTRIWGRAYMNLSRFCDAAWRLFGITPQLITETLGGAHTEIISTDSARSFKSHIRRAINLLRFGMKCNRVASRTDMLFNETLQLCENIRDQLKGTLSNNELLELITSLQQASRSFMYQYLLLVFGAIGSYVLLKKAIRGWTNLNASNAGYLLAGLGNVPSAQMACEIMLMAEAIMEDSEAYEWLLQGNWAGWRESLMNEKLRERVGNFLRDYGHRVINMSELEMANPRWDEDQSSLFETIINCCLSMSTSDVFSSKVQQQRRIQAEMELIRSLPLYLKLPARAILVQAQHYARLRESAKSYLVRWVAVGRELLVVVGKRLAEKRAILRKDDIFFLDVQDITDGLIGKQTDLTEHVLEAKILIARFEKIEPADVFVGLKPYYPESGSSDRVSLRGVPASPGKVTARARVLHDHSEIFKLTPGEVLVCPTIDSSWIPLFFLASGIVTEIGGVLSHGAIIARELGIPTVINVYGAISKIVDGQTLTVDGNQGKVFISLEHVL